MYLSFSFRSCVIKEIRNRNIFYIIVVYLTDWKVKSNIKLKYLQVIMVGKEKAIYENFATKRKKAYFQNMQQRLELHGVIIERSVYHFTLVNKI